jgi:hydroxypyruvate reductase
VTSEGQLRRQALRIFRAAVDAANPHEAILDHMRRCNPRRFENVYVVGAGKAGATMAAALERLPGLRITAGLVNVKYGHTARLRRVELCECGHPVPDRNGMRGAKRIAEIARGAGSLDFVLCLISGGASALLPLPAEGISLADKQATTKALLACGADIHELNTVRKHLSAIKGGQLARLASPATVLTLVLSDVIGDDLDVIGSGPTVPDRSTYAEALDILRRYRLMRRVPKTVPERLERGAVGEIEETPKSGDPIFAHVNNIIVGNNRMAIDAAQRIARTLGYRTMVLSTMIEGEAREVARVHAAIAREIRSSGQPVKPPACIISGGETTVTLLGRGLGGRNQEFVLAAARDIAGLQNVVLLSAGTDGTDGPTDAAGAIADGRTIARATEKGLSAADSLARNDSYRFFEPLGDLIRTGPTGTNVMDVQVVLVG